MAERSHPPSLSVVSLSSFAVSVAVSLCLYLSLPLSRYLSHSHSRRLTCLTLRGVLPCIGRTRDAIRYSVDPGIAIHQEVLDFVRYIEPTPEER